MKVIDLLNKIANKEEVPKKIEIFGYTFFRYEDEWSNFYYYATADKKDELMEQLNSTNELNDEVEITEEPKEIEKLEKRVISENYMIENKNAPEEEKWKLVRNLIYNNSKDTQFVKDKINELIDVINELKKENK
jgi:hypothetical protein